MTNIKIRVYKETYLRGEWEHVEWERDDYRGFTREYGGEFNNIDIIKTHKKHKGARVLVMKNVDYIGTPVDNPSAKQEVFSIQKLSCKDISLDDFVEELKAKYGDIEVLSCATENDKHRVEFTCKEVISVLSISYEQLLRFIDDEADVRIDYDIDLNERIYDIYIL